MGEEAKRYPCSLQGPEAPWSLSPNLPEGTASVRKSYQLDSLYYFFSVFIILLQILCIEFCINTFLKWHLFSKRNNICITMIDVFVRKYLFLRGHRKRGTWDLYFTAYHIYDLVSPPIKIDIYRTPFCILHLVSTLISDSKNLNFGIVGGRAVGNELKPFRRQDYWPWRESWNYQSREPFTWLWCGFQPFFIGRNFCRQSLSQRIRAQLFRKTLSHSHLLPDWK